MDTFNIRALCICISSASENFLSCVFRPQARWYIHIYRSTSIYLSISIYLFRSLSICLYTYICMYILTSFMYNISASEYYSHCSSQPSARWPADYIYIYIHTYTFIGPPVYQCGEHWSGGPSSLVRGAKEKLSIPPRACLQDSVCKILSARFCLQDSVSKIRRPGRSGRAHPNLPDFSKTVNKPLIRDKGLTLFRK